MIKRFGNLNIETELKESGVGAYVLFTDYMKMERAFRKLHMDIDAEFGGGEGVTKEMSDKEVEEVLNGEYDKICFNVNGEPMDYFGFKEEKK